MDSRVGACWRCGRKGGIKCAACELALYCSPECQERDKIRHEVECTNCAVQHECCVCSKVTRDAQTCAACEEIWYCNPTCQKSDVYRHKSARRRHKSICQRSAVHHHRLTCQANRQNIVEVASKLRLNFRVMQEVQKLRSFPYYWGNSPALDLIKIDQNEGEYPDKMAILLVGVGNLRNVMATVAGLKQPFEGSVHFVLNDNDRQVLARNVFFLQFLWKYKGEEKVAQQLTQIWYSVKITEEEATMAQKCLAELLSLPDDTNTLCGGRVAVSAEHWAEMRPVFELWLSLLTGEKVLQMTPQAQLQRTYQLEAEGVETFLHCLPERHRASAEDWIENGILFSKSNPQRSLACRDNVTLAAWNPYDGDIEKAQRLGAPQIALYVGEIAAGINDDGMPFYEWDHLEVKAQSPDDDLQKAYSHYISDVVSRFADMFGQGRVSFHVVLANCLSVRAHLPEDTTRFDRIFTSNVSDYINYPVLLTTLRPLLRKKNSKSVIITECINWHKYLPIDEVTPRPDLRLRQHLFNQAKEDIRHEPDRPDWAKGQVDLRTLARNTPILEYFDNWDPFKQYLRAALLAHKCPESSHTVLSPKDVPKMSEVRNVSGMKMRNFCKELNTVCPFRYRVNARPVTGSFLTGLGRMLEWTLP